MEGHPSHQDIWQACRKYAAEIVKAKTDHWNNFLKNAEGNNIWTVSKYLFNPTGDGGWTRIPTLKVKGDNGNTIEVNTNKGKAKYLAKAFFLPKPTTFSVPQDYNLPPLLPAPLQVTEEQIHYHIYRRQLTGRHLTE